MSEQTKEFLSTSKKTKHGYKPVFDGVPTFDLLTYRCGSFDREILL